MSFFPANSTFWAKAMESEDVRLIRCDIDPDWLEDVTQTRIDWRRVDNAAFFDLQNIYIERTMHRLASELSGCLQGGRAMAEALGTSIAVDLVRQLQPESVDDYVGSGVLSNVRLSRIQDFVHSFADGPPSPAEVAAQAGLSTTYLRRVFKNTTGQTLNQFLEQTRIARARGLLAETTLPLKVVSHALGFARPSAFSVAFKRATGEVPKEYRRRVSVKPSGR
jgi:AraC family transcriptional regulator